MQRMLTGKLMKLNKTNKFWFSGDAWKKRDEAAEKDFIMKEEKMRLERLKKKQREREGESADWVSLGNFDAADVLEARESLVRILTEQGVGVKDDVLIKRLITWKFHFNGE